jgi:hypothetical protein
MIIVSNRNGKTIVQRRHSNQLIIHTSKQYVITETLPPDFKGWEQS